MIDGSRRSGFETLRPHTDNNLCHATLKSFSAHIHLSTYECQHQCFLSLSLVFIQSSMAYSIALFKLPFLKPSILATSSLKRPSSSSDTVIFNLPITLPKCNKHLSTYTLFYLCTMLKCHVNRRITRIKRLSDHSQNLFL